MHKIAIGVRREEQLVVTSEQAIDFLGMEGARVLSTPQMIGYMERTCRDLVCPLLESGYDTVGTVVNVRHLAAAPIGATVRFTAEISGYKERRVEFRVEAWDGAEKIGDGSHERAIIDVARFASRLAAKRGTD
jgi:predicted thioesterase